MNSPEAVKPVITYDTSPEQYKHWKLACDGAIATLTLNINEDGGIKPGYKLKLNSYDLGVDMELHDALQRVRFEHPEVRTVVVTSGKDRIFCSGANIFMLGLSTHAWKVNFCKFTNETRNGIEDSSRYSGLKFLAACNGTTAGGGYELALACDEIILVDDRSSAVSLPEVPLLGVLPGTGGLTRVTDKRQVRHDLADIFCTTTEGVRGQKAKDWRLVDDIAKPAQFAAKVQERALQLAGQSDRPADGKAVTLNTLECRIEPDALRYGFVTVDIDRVRRDGQVQKAHGVPARHAQSPAGLLEGVLDAAVTEPPAVDEQVLQLGVAPAGDRVGAPPQVGRAALGLRQVGDRRPQVQRGHARAGVQVGAAIGRGQVGGGADDARQHHQRRARPQSLARRTSADLQIGLCSSRGW